MSADLRERLQASLGTAYSIQRELGGGGMSRVFVAEETALGRSVVVKVLAPELAAGVNVERFRREILLAARLQHPHIVPLLTAGETSDGLPYFTMPFVEGQALRGAMEKRGALSVAEAIRVLRDIAEALGYAHAHGVVHRDLKPENVLLSGGSAVVTDFGVAKALSAATEEGSGTFTSAGVALGTPAYMAPEQAAADPAVDHRADLYSLGVVAYELLTGQAPFSGRTPQQTLAAQVLETPEPITLRKAGLPPTLATLVMRLLAKHPPDRPQSAEEVLRELDAVTSGAIPASQPPPPTKRPRWVAPAVGVGLLLAVMGGAVYVSRTRLSRHAQPASPVPSSSLPVVAGAAATDHGVQSVAVLPFVNIGARTQEEYFSDGMTDELTGALGKVPGLRVASRTSSFAFKGKSENVSAIGHALNVRSVLEGSIRRDGRRLRVRAQLTDVADGLALWSETYERDEQDVFQVQEDIARAIVSALRVTLTGVHLTGGERLVNTGTSDVVAHDLYLQARFFALKFTEPALRRAIELYREALSRDPNYAPAWAGIADAWSNLGDDFVAPRDAYPNARAAAARAVALDSTQAEAHAALGAVLYNTWDATGGGRELGRALALNPNIASTWGIYSEVLLFRGKLDSAVAANRRAIALDPLDPYQRVALAWTLISANRIDEAVTKAREALALDPHYGLAYVRIGYAQLIAGHPAAALEAYRQVEGFAPRSQAGMAVALARLGRRNEARRVLANMERDAARHYVSGEGIAWAYIALGETDRGMLWLERAVRDRNANLLRLATDPRWEPVRGDPRFVALVQKVQPW
ncbi:MAG: protein kinase [Gemmatimonadota bacterium]